MARNCYDAVIVGAGAAGLAAGSVTAASGCSTLIIDRESRSGGILNQCIHNGFGLRYFKEELTGPEFAYRMSQKAQNAGVEFALDSAVTDIKKLDDGTFDLRILSKHDGVRHINSRAVMLTMGCRERNRGAIATPGGRPAGIFTAGTAQKLLNCEGKLPGKSAVIVGSGDIGLIMARRLRWSGIDVKAVIEIMPHSAGLTRNVVQCLHDFGIPLYLSTSVVRIDGKDRVTGVVAAPLNDDRTPDMNKAFAIECDTVLFSVGLIPEMELAKKLGVKENPATGGAEVDSNYSTSIPGVFSAGNVLHVHDLVDFVAEEAEYAGKCLVDYLVGAKNGVEYNSSVLKNLKYVIPNRFAPTQDTRFLFRPTVVTDRAVLKAMVNGESVWEKKLLFVRPAEMIIAEIKANTLAGDVTFVLEEI
ncbi:MAG: pyridine nucleotide-disulfide oxidoreductase [Lentisphaerae bacterium]|nr:pyridine nucleotide-disulfide oxidoreductase [Lentisphaerota bacterium]